MGSKEEICTIVEVSCPADLNISRKIDEKLNNYAPLVRNMQIMYSNSIINLLLSPLLLEPLVMFQNVFQNICPKLGFDNLEINRLM